MPTVAGFIDAMRAAFGAEAIDPSIRAGMNGQPTFWAKENGIEVGTRAAYDAKKVVTGAEIQIAHKKPDTAPRRGY